MSSSFSSRLPISSRLKRLRDIFCPKLLLPAKHNLFFLRHRGIRGKSINSRSFHKVFKSIPVYTRVLCKRSSFAGEASSTYVPCLPWTAASQCTYIYWPAMTHCPKPGTLLAHVGLVMSCLKATCAGLWCNSFWRAGRRLLGGSVCFLGPNLRSKVFQGWDIFLLQHHRQVQRLSKTLVRFVCRARSSSEVHPKFMRPWEHSTVKSSACWARPGLAECTNRWGRMTRSVATICHELPWYL